MRYFGHVAAAALSLAAMPSGYASMMAKPKTEPSAAQIALDKARENLKAATSAHEKAATEPNMKKVTEAKAAVAVAAKAANRDRFERVGGVRVQTALAALELVGKMNTPGSYDYEEADVTAIETALNAATAAAVKALRDAKTAPAGGKATGKKVFAFGKAA